MAVPTPLTAVAINKISAAGFNSGVRDPLSFLLDPPRCDVSLGSNISVTDGVATLITYDTEELDTDTMHSTASNTSRITFTTAGRYLVHVYVMWSSLLLSRCIVNVRLNSGGSSAGGSSIRSFDFNTSSTIPSQMCIPLERLFNATDYIEVFVTQTSGGTRPLQGGNGKFCTGLTARWIQIS